MKGRFLLAVLTVVAGAVVVQAQNGPAPDRSRVPGPGPTPTLHVPAWTKQQLPNGALLVVAEKHDLPLVSFSITFLGGTAQFETAEKRGAGELMTAMLSEGTTTRSGDQLSDDLRRLGTSVNAGIGTEDGVIDAYSTSDKFEATLGLLSDMMLHPAFPPEALERLRARTLVSLQQAKSQPASIAARVFPRVIYGNSHPYGVRVTEESIKAITRDDIVALHKAYYQPGRAIITVVGDVDAKAMPGLVEKYFPAWAGGTKAAFSYPAVTPIATTGIYLVDKPGAAQSVFAMGFAGPPRGTPDFYALEVLNFILGGHFQSRLNHNIREVHGYSYGVNSSFGFGKGPGPFRAGGAIVSDKSDAAMVEFMNELKGVVAEKPITDAEMATAKASLIQRLPAAFASVTAIRSAITSLYTQDLPENYYQEYAKNINGVTKEDLGRVAGKYLTLDHMAIVIVGDKAAISGPLAATKIAPISELDIEGAPAGRNP